MDVLAVVLRCMCLVARRVWEYVYNVWDNLAWSTKCGHVERVTTELDSGC